MRISKSKFEIMEMNVTVKVEVNWSAAYPINDLLVVDFVLCGANP